MGNAFLYLIGLIYVSASFVVLWKILKKTEILIGLLELSIFFMGFVIFYCLIST